MGLLAVLQGGEGGPPSSCLSFPAPAWGAPWLATAASSWGCGDRTGVRTAPPRAGCRAVRATGIVTATQLRNEPRQLRWHRELYGGWEQAAAPSTNTAPACILGAVGRIRPLNQGEQGWQRDRATHCHSLRTGQSAGGWDGDATVVGTGRMGRGCWIWTGWAPRACPHGLAPRMGSSHIVFHGVAHGTAALHRSVLLGVVILLGWGP